MHNTLIEVAIFGGVIPTYQSFSVVGNKEADKFAVKHKWYNVTK